MKDSELLQFKLMLPAALKLRIEEQAVLNRRSLSQEIVTALEEQFPPPKPETTSDPAAKILYWLSARIRRGNPRSGSFGDRRAALYESLAADIETRVDSIQEASTNNE